MLISIFLRNTFALLCLLLTIKVHFASCLIDPLTLGVSAGIGVGIYSYGFIKQQTYCRYSECCDERSVPLDINGLKEKLKQSLYGQHIVMQQLIPALAAHFGSKASRKPLVISFHGTPGTGKNFVADLVAEAMFAKGVDSQYVHKYLGRADFSMKTMTNEYKNRIDKEVREGIADCSRSLFIFDEVDKMPAGIFESLVSLVDYNTLIKGSDYTQAVFIFLSNTGGVHIADRLGKLIKTGTLRDETRLNDFEPTLKAAAYNKEGGFHKTGLIEAHVIDHYLPFLPLEQQHVRKCLETEFKRWGRADMDKQIEQILNDYVTYETTHSLFATSGCKTLEKKVAVAVFEP